MKNRDVAKTVLATGAAVVVVLSAPPIIVGLPICIGIGAYMSKLLFFTPEEKKKAGDESNKTDSN